MDSIGLAYGLRLVAKTTQNRPREIDDLLGAELAKRGYPARLGICHKCNEDYYTFGFGPFCSNRCAQFKTGDNGSGYLRCTVNGKRDYIHRHSIKAKKGFIVHHINGDKSDNRPGNLEVMTQAQHCKEHAPHLARWGEPVSLVCLVCGIAGRLRRGYCQKHRIRKTNRSNQGAR